MCRGFRRFGSPRSSPRGWLGSVRAGAAVRRRRCAATPRGRAPSADGWVLRMAMVQSGSAEGDDDRPGLARSGSWGLAPSVSTRRGWIPGSTPRESSFIPPGSGASVRHTPGFAILSFGASGRMSPVGGIVRRFRFESLPRSKRLDVARGRARILGGSRQSGSCGAGVGVAVRRRLWFAEVPEPRGRARVC